MQVQAFKVAERKWWEVRGGELQAPAVSTRKAARFFAAGCPQVTQAGRPRLLVACYTSYIPRPLLLQEHTAPNVVHISSAHDLAERLVGDIYLRRMHLQGAPCTLVCREVG